MPAMITNRHEREALVWLFERGYFFDAAGWQWLAPLSIQLSGRDHQALLFLSQRGYPTAVYTAANDYGVPPRERMN